MLIEIYNLILMYLYLFINIYVIYKWYKPVIQCYSYSFCKMLNALVSSSPPMYEFLLKGDYSAYFGALYPQGECSLHAFRYSAHLSYVHTRDLVYAVSSTARDRSQQTRATTSSCAQRRQFADIKPVSICLRFNRAREPIFTFKCRCFIIITWFWG